MPVCLNGQQLVNYGNGSRLADGKVLVGGPNGLPITPITQPHVAVFGPISGRCDFMAITVEEFEKFNVTAEVNQATNAWEELGNMSIKDAQVISAYIAVVWAIAWGFRVLRSAVVDYYESSQNE